MTHDNVTDIERRLRPEDARTRPLETATVRCDLLTEAADTIATLRKQLENAREALRPFAEIVGKRNSAVTLTIGNDTWTHVLTTKHFETAADVYRSKP